jgi:hypothetical protein
MNKNISQWIVVYLLPYSVVAVSTLMNGVGLGGAKLDGAIIVLKTIFIPMVASPFLASMGYIIGFTAETKNAPFYTVEFKLALVACFIVSIVMFVVGVKNRNKLWGKALNATGFYLWCIGGLVSLAPSI